MRVAMALTGSTSIHVITHNVLSKAKSSQSQHYWRATIELCYRGLLQWQGNKLAVDALSC